MLQEASPCVAYSQSGSHGGVEEECLDTLREMTFKCCVVYQHLIVPVGALTGRQAHHVLEVLRAPCAEIHAADRTPWVVSRRLAPMRPSADAGSMTAWNAGGVSGAPPVIAGPIACVRAQEPRKLCGQHDAAVARVWPTMPTGGHK